MFNPRYESGFCSAEFVPCILSALHRPLLLGRAFEVSNALTPGIL